MIPGCKFLLAALCLTAMFSCSKSSSSNNTTTNTSAFVGFWAGTGTITSPTTTTEPVTLVLKTDGKMRLYLNSKSAADTAAVTAANKSDGTYTTSGTTVTCSYTTSGALLLLAATANTTYTSMTGTAGLSPATSGVGTFTFTKQ